MTRLAELRGRLIVSCQALPGEPLHGPAHMAAMARSAVIGGAAGVRVNGPDDVAAVRAAVDVPVIGLWKDGTTGVYITPTVEHARRLAAAGADVIALDATARPRPDGLSAADAIAAVRAETGLPVLADVSTFEEGVDAAEAGADAVAGTLSGYVPGQPAAEGPDLELVSRLAAELNVPVIAEGRITTPQEAAEAIRRGAFAAVVGGAITRPADITRRFVTALPSALSVQESR